MSPDILDGMNGIYGMGDIPVPVHVHETPQTVYVHAHVNVNGKRIVIQSIPLIPSLLRP